MKSLLLACLLVVFIPGVIGTEMYHSLAEFGLSSTNDPAKNKAAIQRAIDWASARGAALFLEPSEEPYPVDGGIILKRNVSIIGVHGPVGRGTRHPDKP